ncbi:MAG: hypothetical protein R3A52_01705 [Polyangiales bacterium]
MSWLPFNGALRGPTTICHVALAVDPVLAPVRASARQNTTPVGRSAVGAPLVPVASKLATTVAQARSRQNCTRAPSVPAASAQRTVGRREVTVAVESGASNRGAVKATHAPDTQLKPEAQTRLHVPQLVGAVSAASQPLASTPSQLAKPAAQAPSAQVPVAHDAVALAREQTAPQPPQLLAVLSAASQPLAALPSQSPKPAGHVGATHAPPVQTRPAAQAAPQAPQLAVVLSAACSR